MSGFGLGVGPRFPRPVGLESGWEDLKEKEKPPWRDHITRSTRRTRRHWVHFLTKNGQVLLPMVELIEQSRLAVDEVIDVLGRASTEAVFSLAPSASLSTCGRGYPPPCR